MADLTPTSKPLYDLLAKEWPRDQIRKLNKGGIQLDYLDGEQVVTRLNETLGFDGWSFEVTEHGYNEEADEVWVLGKLTVYAEPRIVIREQFGSQQIARRKTDSRPLDMGFVLKGASTDALKKCASLIGVGLFLYEKEPRESDDTQAFAQAHQQRAAEDRPAASSRPAAPKTPAQNTNAEQVTGLVCKDCGAPLEETRFKDGTVWSPAQLAAYGRRKHGRALCMTHYREANDAVRRAQSLEAVPF